MDMNELNAYLEEVTGDLTEDQMFADLRDSLAGMSDSERLDKLVDAMSTGIALIEGLNEVTNVVVLTNPATPPLITGVVEQFLNALPEDQRITTAARLIASAYLSLLESSGDLIDMLTGSPYDEDTDASS